MALIGGINNSDRSLPGLKTISAAWLGRKSFSVLLWRSRLEQRISSHDEGWGWDGLYGNRGTWCSCFVIGWQDKNRGCQVKGRQKVPKYYLNQMWGDWETLEPGQCGRATCWETNMHLECFSVLWELGIGKTEINNRSRSILNIRLWSIFLTLQHTPYWVLNQYIFFKKNCTKQDVGRVGHLSPIFSFQF